ADVQPATLGVVERHLRLRAACHQPERRPCGAAAKIPERGVDRGERERRDRTDRRGVRGPEEPAPERLDLTGVLPDELADEVLAEERKDGASAGADRVGVAAA